MTNSFVTNAVLIECELLTSASADLADYTINIWLSALGLLQSELKMNMLEVEGGRHVPQCPTAGDAIVVCDCIACAARCRAT